MLKNDFDSSGVLLHSLETQPFQPHPAWFPDMQLLESQTWPVAWSLWCQSQAAELSPPDIIHNTQYTATFVREWSQSLTMDENRSCFRSPPLQHLTQLQSTQPAHMQHEELTRQVFLSTNACSAWKTPLPLPSVFYPTLPRGEAPCMLGEGERSYLHQETTLPSSQMSPQAITNTLSGVLWIIWCCPFLDVFVVCFSADRMSWQF